MMSAHSALMGKRNRIDLVFTLTTVYTHDDFGRRTGESSAAGDITYTWNTLGQLASVTSADTTSTFAYGPTGMRERAHVVSSAESTTTDYAWTGAQLAAMRVTHASETAGGVVTAVTDYRFVYGPDSLPLEMIVIPEGGTPVSYAYQCDRAGSVVALTDHSGAVVASYAYDPYGRLLATGGSDPALAGTNPLRYRGYSYDEATGHYYLPARYYDPATARFLSADPAPPVAGDPLSLNRYAYCVGDPINFHDRTGARHEMGSGVAGRVSTDAIELAKKGQLDSAKKVQTRFRNAVSSNYAKGYDFVQAGRIAEIRASSFALSSGYGPQGDGTQYGCRNLTLDRSREHGYIGFEGTGSAVEIGGQLLGYAASHNGQKQLAKKIEQGGLIVDAAGIAHALYEWNRGEATLADVGWNVWGLVPGANTAQLLLDIGFSYAEYRGGYDFGWAQPIN